MKELLLAWIVVAAAIGGVMMLIGVAVRSSAFGILVDSRNRMSLSRFQMTVWTILIVSAFFVVAVKNGTMDIYIAPEIWALLGISVGSTAGSVIVNANKAKKQPNQADVTVKSRVDSLPHKRMGVLAVMEKPQFKQMFLGEEVVDHDHVDIAKVQMFFFTIAAVGGYAVALWGVDFSAQPAGLEETHKTYFPLLSTSIVALLGISHTGYLTVKAAPSTPST